MACGKDDEDAALVTVVVPAFNEANRLADRAQRFKAAVDSGLLDPRRTELIVVDDGSTDETGEVATQLLTPIFERLQVIRQNENAGKGAAIRLGIKSASAPVVLFMDADMSVDPMEIPHLAAAMEHADVAIGSRELPGSLVEVDSVRRRIMGRTFNVLVSTLTDLPYRDTQCGFKAFRTPLARLLFHWMQVQRFAFDVEILCLARRLHMNVVEIPVHWREVRRSSVRMVADPLSMARDVLRVRNQEKWPSVPGLAIVGEKRHTVQDPSKVVVQVARALGPTYPMMLTPGHQHPIVLLPLCDPPEIDAVSKVVQGIAAPFVVEERAVSFDAVAQVAPFLWLECTTAGAVDLAATAADCSTTKVAVAGWQPLPSSSAQSIGRSTPR